MNRPESIAVGLALGVACPLLTFVVFWWTTAVIHMHLPGMPVQAVIVGALTGLAFGIALDIVYLKRWIEMFYAANIWILAAVYLGLCVVAVAFFMGLPAGTFLLGIGSGVYIGRRQRHTQTDSLSAILSIRTTAFFAALVTTAAALPIGLLALGDGSVLELLETRLGFDQADLRGFAGLILIGVLCLVLFVGQYWCSKIAGQVAFTVGRGDAQPGAAADGASRRG